MSFHEVPEFTGPELAEAVATVVALGAVAGVVAASVAFVVRLYSRQPAPTAFNVLVGFGALGVYLNLVGSLGHFVEGETALLETEVMLVNASSLALGAVTATYGGRFGDELALETPSLSKLRYDGDVAKFVRARGRAIRVKLPDEVEDIDGYEPVDDDVKSAIAGQELVFPRGLTVDELRDHVVERLKSDYDVGYVDLEVDERGEVGFLGLASRVSGLGPTLGPGTCAVAVRADPAYASSPGDRVQLWEPGDESPARVATAELRGAAGDVVTLALDRADAARLDQSRSYWLMTLPSEKGPEKELAAMLRAADETMSAVEVAGGSALEGAPVSSVGVPVVAVRHRSGEVEAVPPRTRLLEPGDTVYAVGRPDQLRKLYSGASAVPSD